MRLIDADVLKTYLKYVSEADVVSLKKIIKAIDKQTTAYDIDKVVEELEDELAYWKAEHYHQQIAYAKAVSYAHAIEIVKQGGVSDDACEWQIDGDIAINPHNLCRYKIKQYDGLYKLDICRHCKKKIKVVE